MELRLSEPEYDSSGNPIRKRKFYPPPPLLYTAFEYQDMGKDMKFRKDVTDFFHAKVLKWITNYKEFSHLKKYYNFLKSDKGYLYIYELLRLFCKKSKLNWFDLRDNYPILKDYFKLKIGSI